MGIARRPSLALSTHPSGLLASLFPPGNPYCIQRPTGSCKNRNRISHSHYTYKIWKACNKAYGPHINQPLLPFLITVLRSPPTTLAFLLVLGMGPASSHLRAFGLSVPCVWKTPSPALYIFDDEIHKWM